MNGVGKVMDFFQWGLCESVIFTTMHDMVVPYGRRGIKVNNCAILSPKVHRPPAMMDITSLQVSGALVPCLLGQGSELKYDDDAGRINKQTYKPFLERIASNVNHMLANIGKYRDLITNDKPMTRDRTVRDLMNRDQNAETITMAEYWNLMNAQQTLLMGLVDVVRGKLVAHGIAISNLAVNDKWEATCIVAELINTIEAKEKAEPYLPAFFSLGKANMVFNMGFKHSQVLVFSSVMR